MATHAKKENSRLFVRRTELHCCKTAAASHPDQKKMALAPVKQDEPAEMRNDETLDGTEGRPRPAPEGSMMA